MLGLLAPGAHAGAQSDRAGGAQRAAPVGEWQQLLQLTGIEQVLRQLPAHFSQGVEQAKAEGEPIPPEVEAALKAAVDEVFGFEVMQGAAIALLQASLTPEQLADWLAFYRTPLGRKLAAADERAASPAFHSMLMEQTPQVMATLSKDVSRMALIQSFLQATDAVEQLTNAVLQTQLAVAWGLISTSPQTGGTPTFEETKQAVNEQRFAVRAQMAQMGLVYFAAAYQEFSQQELGLLLQRANSPAGKALYVDFSRRLYQTLAVFAEKIGQAMGRRLAEQSAGKTRGGEGAPV